MPGAEKLRFTGWFPGSGVRAAVRRFVRCRPPDLPDVRRSRRTCERTGIFCHLEAWLGGLIGCSTVLGTCRDPVAALPRYSQDSRRIFLDQLTLMDKVYLATAALIVMVLVRAAIFNSMSDGADVETENAINAADKKGLSLLVFAFAAVTAAIILLQRRSRARGVRGAMAAEAVRVRLGPGKVLKMWPWPCASSRARPGGPVLTHPQ